MTDWITGTHEIDSVPVWFRRRPAETEGRESGSTGSSGGERPVLLLHGGLSDSRVFDALVAYLPPNLALWSYDRRGHGRTSDTDEPLGFESMLDEAVALITDLIGAPVHLVGHSDGASLSLLLAARRPDLVVSVCAFSGNLDPTGLVPGEVTVEQLAAAVGPDYGAVSPDGIEHLPVVASKIIRLWATEPQITPADLASISCPVLIAAGENDSIRDEHTRLIHASIQGARLAIVTGASHMLIVGQAAQCGQIVTETLSAGASLSRRMTDNPTAELNVTAEH